MIPGVVIKGPRLPIASRYYLSNWVERERENPFCMCKCVYVCKYMYVCMLRVGGEGNEARSKAKCILLLLFIFPAVM